MQEINHPEPKGKQLESDHGNIYKDYEIIYVSKSQKFIDFSLKCASKHLC